jgi:hypothetical protein
MPLKLKIMLSPIEKYQYFSKTAIPDNVNVCRSVSLEDAHCHIPYYLHIDAGLSHH